MTTSLYGRWAASDSAEMAEKGDSYRKMEEGQILYSSVVTVLEFHSEAGEIQLIFIPK